MLPTHFFCRGNTIASSYYAIVPFLPCPTYPTPRCSRDQSHRAACVTDPALEDLDLSTGLSLV